MCILFPELKKLVPTLHRSSVYALLSEFSGADAIASAHLTRLSHLLSESSKGRYGKDTAVSFREAARNSIDFCYACKVAGIEAYHQTHSEINH